MTHKTFKGFDKDLLKKIGKDQIGCHKWNSPQGGLHERYAGAFYLYTTLILLALSKTLFQEMHSPEFWLQWLHRMRGYQDKR
jgi:hypothetical protein